MIFSFSFMSNRKYSYIIQSSSSVGVTFPANQKVVYITYTVCQLEGQFDLEGQGQGQKFLK